MSPVDLKKCKMEDLSNYTNEELEARLRDLRDDLLEQNVGLATNQASDFSRRESLKRAIARCLMIIRQRELGQLPTPAAAAKPAREKPSKERPVKDKPPKEKAVREKSPKEKPVKEKKGKGK